MTAVSDYGSIKKIKMTMMVRMIGRIFMQVNIQQAKTGLSYYIRMLETKQVKQIYIARRGTPIAKLTLINEKPIENRIGIAAGRIKAPEDLDRHNAEIAALFGGAE